MQGVDDGHAELAGLNGIVLEVLHGVETLDDARARGLRAQASLLHLLDELALAVASGRLGLLRVKREVANVHDVTLGKGRELLVSLEAKRVDGAEPRHLEHVTGGHERLAGNVDGELRPLDGRGVGERGEEAPRDEVVEFPLGGLEL